MHRYKSEVSREERAKESARVLKAFPDRIPVIVEPMSSRAPPIDKRRFLVPNDLTMGQLMYVIRKRVRLPAEQAMFLFVQRAIPPTASPLSEVYERSRDPDGHLYVEYDIENAFG